MIEDLNLYDEGTFSVTSGLIRVSDPCYGKDVWCTVAVPAAIGTWRACLEWEGSRIKTMGAFLAGEDPKGLSIRMLGEAGVDSGQLAIWDDADWSNDDERYELIGQHTLSPTKSYIGPHGMAAQTAYGDGGYGVQGFFKSDGTLAGITVDFM